MTDRPLLTHAPADAVEHAADCPDPVSQVREWTGRQGDRMVTCNACRRGTMLAPAERPARPAPTAPRTPELEQRTTTGLVIPCATCGEFLPHAGLRPALRWCRTCERTRGQRHTPRDDVDNLLTTTNRSNA